MKLLIKYLFVWNLYLLSLSTNVIYGVNTPEKGSHIDLSLEAVKQKWDNQPTEMKNAVINGAITGICFSSASHIMSPSKNLFLVKLLAGALGGSCGGIAYIKSKKSGE